MYQRHQHIHFVGIGGIGMSGIAELLINLGHRVSGSDLKKSDITARLESMGAVIHQGHHPRQVEGADVVVVSSAVTEDNPEVRAAQQLHVPVIPRAEMLAELMRLKYGIDIAGAHGKTTCTSTVAQLLAAGGLDPTVVVGGRLGALGSNAWLGKGDFLVAEADESDGSFNRLSPVLELITNVDREHMDHYGSDQALDQAFVEFMNKVPFYGAAVICLDDDRLAGLIPRVRKRTVTYGFTPQADFQARDVQTRGTSTSFSLYRQGEHQGRVQLPLPGRHNVLNALGALAVAQEAGVELELAMAACRRFSGVGRRFERVGRSRQGALVMDDYAHHPTEIRATLEAARDCWPQARLLVCFQPHRYTRTKLLLEEFATAFYGTDMLLVLDIYPAGEPKIPGVTARKLVQAISSHGHRGVEYLGGFREARERLERLLGPGDVLFTMGAGNVWKIGRQLCPDEEEGER